MKRSAMTLKRLIFTLPLLLLCTTGVIAQTYNVEWSEFVYTQISSNDLQKDAPQNAWSAGAVSRNMLLPRVDGEFEYVPDNTLNYKIIGYKVAPMVNVVNRGAYEYAFYLHEGGTLEAMENGAVISLGNYTSGDVLTLERTNSTIYYKVNGSTIRSISVDWNEPLLIAACIYTEYAEFKNVTCSFENEEHFYNFTLTDLSFDGAPGSISLSLTGGSSPYTYSWNLSESTTSSVSNVYSDSYTVSVTDDNEFTSTHDIGLGYPIDWTGVLNMTVANNDLTKTSSTNWDAGAYSNNVLPANTDGWVEIIIKEVGKSKFLGLTTEPITNITDILSYKYSIYCNTKGEIYRYLNGVGTNLCSFQVGDVIRIERIGTTMHWKLNGVSLLQATVPASEELVVAANLKYLNEKWEDVHTSFNIPLTVAVTTTEQTPTVQGSVSLAIEGGATPYKIFWDDSETLLTEGAFDTIIGYLDTIRYDSLSLDAPAFTELKYLDFIQSHERRSLTDLDGDLFNLTVTDQEGATFTKDVYVPSELSTGTISGATYSDGIITKTAATGWDNMTFDINNSIPGNKDSWFSFTAAQTNAVLAVGLTPTTVTGSGYTDMAYAFYLDNATVKIMEDGVFTSETATLTTGDVLRIERVGSNINYVHNGTILRTIATDASKAYLNKVEINSALASISAPHTPEPYWINPKVIIDHARCGFESGTITLDLSKVNDGPFTYSWSTGSTQKDITGLSPGTYTVTITSGTNYVQVLNYDVGNKVRWSELQNTTPDYPDDNTLVKNNGGTGWNGSGISENKSTTIITTPILWAEFTLNEDYPSYTIFGFKKSSSVTIPFAFETFSLTATDHLVFVRELNGASHYVGHAASGDQLRLEHTLATNTIAYYKNKVLMDPNPYFMPITTAQYTATGPIGDNVNVGAELFHQPEEVLYAITNLGCESISQYGQLKKKPDGGYYKIMDGKVRFKYREKYNDSDGLLSFKIYDDFHNDVTTTYSSVNPQTLVYGENWFDIDVTSLSAGHYLLEVINEKNEKNYLRFKI